MSSIHGLLGLELVGEISRFETDLKEEYKANTGITWLTAKIKTKEERKKEPRKRQRKKERANRQTKERTNFSYSGFILWKTLPCKKITGSRVPEAIYTSTQRKSIICGIRGKQLFI